MFFPGGIGNPLHDRLSGEVLDIGIDFRELFRPAVDHFLLILAQRHGFAEVGSIKFLKISHQLVSGLHFPGLVHLLGIDPEAGHTSTIGLACLSKVSNAVGKFGYPDFSPFVVDGIYLSFRSPGPEGDNFFQTVDIIIKSNGHFWYLTGGSDFVAIIYPVAINVPSGD